MKLERLTVMKYAIAFLIASVIVLTSGTVALDRFQLGAYDLLFRLGYRVQANPHIVIVEIDDENIEKIGRWPWERKWHATIALVLKELGAREIFFDMLLSEPSDQENDMLLMQGLKQAGNVYLPIAVKGRLPSPERTIMPLEVFAKEAADTGAINISPDIDGVLRKIPLFFILEDKVYYHVALKMAMSYLGLRIRDIAFRRVVLTDGRRDTVVPLIDDNRMLLNWPGTWARSFRHYSFLEVLSAYKAFKDGKPPEIDLGVFNDSICLVGVTAVGLYDIKSTSLEPEYPAIGVLATAISNIMDGKFISTAPVWISWLLIFLMGFIPAFWVSDRRTLNENISVVFIAPVLFIISFVLFQYGVWVDYTMPLLAFTASYSSVAVFTFVWLSIEKQRYFKMSLLDELTGLFNKRYLHIVLENECAACRVEIDRNFCVIMLDIDSFKKVNDTYGHKVGDAVLREVARVAKRTVRMSDIVARYGGEELVILLRSAELNVGMSLAEKIRKGIEENVVKEQNKVISVTASLGVASYQKNDTADSIVKRADEGLYKAKAAGRNKIATMEGAQV